jgi:hypothetical protein
VVISAGEGGGGDVAVLFLLVFVRERVRQRPGSIGKVERYDE